MFGFLCGIAVGLAIGYVLWAKGRTIEVRSVDQSGNTAGGDIVGGDKRGD